MSKPHGIPNATCIARRFDGVKKSALSLGERADTQFPAWGEGKDSICCHGVVDMLA
jgi:hypothetical protein